MDSGLSPASSLTSGDLTALGYFSNLKWAIAIKESFY